MSMLIKGMKMPENCFHCQMGYRYGDVDNAKLMCTITAKVIPLGKSLDIMENCPLVEIPPHGRLIDADALIKRATTVGETDDLWDYYPQATQDFVDYVNDAPTIIESEEE